jgi:hypothetical protein
MRKKLQKKGVDYTLAIYLLAGLFVVGIAGVGFVRGQFTGPVPQYAAETINVYYAANGVSQDGTLGASPGPTHFQFQEFRDGAQTSSLSFGQTLITTLSGGTTSTLSAANLCDSRIVEWDSQDDAQLTLPDAVDIVKDPACLNRVGAMKILIYDNISTASSTQFIPGASSTISYMTASSTLGEATTTLEGADTAIFHIIYATSSTASTEMIKYHQVRYKN